MEVGKRKRRFTEWALLTGVALAPAIYSSFYPSATLASAGAGNGPLLFTALNEALMLALLAYLLRRQERDFSDIGFSFKAGDIRAAFILTALGYGAALLSYGVVVWTYYLIVREPLPLAPKNIGFLASPPNAGLAVLLAVNPFFEELIVRAYTITEIEFLTGSPLIAVIVSAVLQLSYHSYQGLYALVTVAPIAILFSLYFAKWRHACPIALAHMVFDLLLLCGWPKS